MKCDVDGCEKEAEHTTMISAAFSDKPMISKANLCDEHFEGLIYGTPRAISIGCSIKNEKDINS